MISIKHTSLMDIKLSSVLHRHNIVNIKVDVAKLDADIDRLRELIGIAVDAGSEYSKMLDYLIGFKSKIKEDSTYDIVWSVVDGCIYREYPLGLKLMSYNGINIDMTRYINVDKRVIRVSYKPILEAIALEIMYRDLDESFESVEKKLHDLGIMAIYPYDRLKSRFDLYGDDILDLAEFMRVGDSPYLSPEKKTIYDYFGCKQFESKTYKPVIDYSKRIALSYICYLIMSGYAVGLIDLYSINDSMICFGFSEKASESMYKELLDFVLSSACITVFGRKFEVLPLFID